MADDLDTYKIHLQQVEAALIADPSNDELLKLKSDLIEVIKLTTDLHAEQASAVDNVQISSTETGAGSSHQLKESNQTWNVTDECLVQWSEDNQWYKARIDSITNNSMAAVTFLDYDTTEFVSLLSLKNISEASTLISNSAQKSNNQRKRTNQQHGSGQDSERFKIRKKKKYDRQKMIDQAHEQDKKKWLQFSNKGKKLKGVNRKSIFATPDAANGRVGIGTCGIGGRPMTDFAHAEKRKRGT